MNKIIYWSSTRRVIEKQFTKTAKIRLVAELDRLVRGMAPNNFKPMHTIGRGAEELRIWDDQKRTYRVIYTVRIKGYVFIIDAFEKKTQRTEKRDIDRAKNRLREIEAEYVTNKKG